MSVDRSKFKALFDAGVPDSVADVFAAFGHPTILYRDVLPEKVPDDVVCATALTNDAVLVAFDRDMKQFAQRYGMTPRNDRFVRLSVIRLSCEEPQAAKRLPHVMSLIEHEWIYAAQKAARRMWIDVSLHFIRTAR